MKTIILIASLLCAGCSKNEENFQPVTIEPIAIASGDLYSTIDIPEQQTIINDANEWNNLLANVPPVANDFTETSIDFNNFVVIVLVDHRHSNGGHGILPQSIIEQSDEIEIDVEVTDGGPCALCPYETQPFNIFKIPISPKQIVFL